MLSHWVVKFLPSHSKRYQPFWFQFPLRGCVVFFSIVYKFRFSFCVIKRWSFVSSSWSLQSQTCSRGERTSSRGSAWRKAALARLWLMEFSPSSSASTSRTCAWVCGCWRSLRTTVRRQSSAWARTHLGGGKKGSRVSKHPSRGLFCFHWLYT